MSRNDPSLMIRLPTKLKEQIRSSASRNRRTLTGEVIFQLEQIFEAKNATAEAAATVSAE